MTTRLIRLTYVGKKLTAFDNIARSGVTWNGHGDVQEVNDAQAKRLLAYPDQWQLTDEADRAAVTAPISLTALGDDGAPVAVDPAALTIPLEKMSKAELRALAAERWGKTFDGRASAKTMIDQIEEWEKDVDLKTGVE